MRFPAAFFILAWMLCGAATGQEESPPAFTQPPTATKDANGGAVVRFAVDRATDVAVYIENAQGHVVRHLAAGVLGPNAPAPLKKDNLAQELAWDGKGDYGREAGAGPFKVRVALGMDVRFDKVAVRDENGLNHIKGLATGPDGTVYVLDAQGSVWKGDQIIAFDREGKYKRSVLPFPANLTAQQSEGLGTFELRGRIAPLTHTHRLQLFPGEQAPRKTAMAVTPDGKVLLRLTGDKNEPVLAAVGTDGSAPWPEAYTPKLVTQTVPPTKDNRFRGGWSGQPALAVSSDSKWAYFAGVTYQKAPYATVFRVALPARSEAQPFFGKIEEAGADNTHLGGVPEGLAVDGKGHLLVSDTANNRVVAVKEADGSFAGSFASPAPGPLAVDPKSGAVYVASKGQGKGKGVVNVLKYDGWKSGKETGKAAFRCDGNGSFVMAFDAGAPKPILWFGTDGGSLIRIEDLGAALSEAATVSSKEGTSGFFLDMSVDRFRPGRELYWRGSNDFWYRYHEDTEKLEKIMTAQNAGLRNGGGGGAQVMAGPDEHLYALKYPYHLVKMDRDAKPVGFPEGGYPESALAKYGKMEKPRGMKGGMWVPANMTEVKHTLGIRADGDLFVLHPLGSGGRPPKALHRYAPSGKKLTTDPIIWKVSDGCVGPRFDAAGNIYVAEIVNPGERPYPKVFEDLFGKIEMEKSRPSGVQDEIANMYGSIVKFSPKGGMFHLPGDDPFEGKPKLEGLKTIDAAFYSNNQQKPLKITGAEWLAFGYSHVEVNACVCETTRFDVDEFGRVFYPDLCQYQVRVVDTAGNPILNFGDYGNADSAGPGSAVPEPAIAFAWLVGVLATDKYVYTGDSLNRRLLRLKYVYAAEARAEIR